MVNTEITTAFTTGLTSIKTDILAFAEIALPVGLTIMGFFLAVRYGMKFFKAVSK